jgi:hypothetical protein
MRIDMREAPTTTAQASLTTAVIVPPRTTGAGSSTGLVDNTYIGIGIIGDVGTLSVPYSSDGNNGLENLSNNRTSTRKRLEVSSF